MIAIYSTALIRIIAKNVVVRAFAPAQPRMRQGRGTSSPGRRRRVASCALALLQRCLHIYKGSLLYAVL